MEIIYNNSFLKIFSTMMLVFQLFSEINGTKDFNRESVNAVLWFQKSAEAKAMYHQGYEIAKMRLIQIKQEKSSDTNLAVVLDIDETILDNSPFQASLAYSFQTYNSQLWRNWTSEKSAQLLPGVQQFFEVADSLGFEIFLLSNRNTNELDDTYENLQRFRLSGLKKENILLREYESSKKERRDLIKINYSIELYLGDNLNDFDDLFDSYSLTERVNNVDALSSKFGSKFIIFPNPMYGSWEDLLYQEIQLERNSSNKSKIRKNSLEIFKKYN